eukprot:XP_014004562.1 PREDICTED: hydrocephalus-inducing protein homolog isoform X1 [Salmo salar]
MPTSKVQASHAALPSLPLKIPEGFKSKVVAPRNPKLVRREDRPKRLTPSAFAQEMSQSTEERLANTHEMHPPRILELIDMSETTHQKFSTIDVDQAMFQPYPSEIVFQNYTPSETYAISLILRNNDKIPRLVKVVEGDSLYFKVVSPVDVCSKVAPGMASTFSVLFTPQENKDYIHRLICVTERERFEVPIRAIGARAILDFPDHLHFSLCPVKCSSQKTLLVRNIGNCEAKFQLSTHSPFSVEPPLGTIGVGESMQVTVDFLPKTAGDHSQDLLLHYHTGEDVGISLYGASADVNVRLDRNSVIVEKTYISMANQRSVSIVNRSDTLVHYQWKSLATKEEEEQQKLRFCSELQREEEDDMDQFLTECDADPTLRDRLSLLSRTFQDRRRQLKEERLSFSDNYITVEPLEGDIWPNTTSEVNIIFKPQEAKIYQQTVYCDITGRESRLPLRIKGEGLGPKLQFNFDLLDMGTIFIGSKHSYEVLLSNNGLIEATFKLVPPSSGFGQCFSFSPTEGMVPPGACQAMEVCFSSSTLGVFSEEFIFTVGGNPQPISLTFRGCVIGPTFHFSVSELNFGDVSFGFPHTLTCSLNNTSLVPINFGLRVPGDGSGPPSITSVSQVSDLSRTEWSSSTVPDRPIEFTLTPDSGTVRPQGLVDIQVTLCSNSVQRYSLALVVDVQGVGEDVLALPINARCVIPNVLLDTPVLQFQRCFLSYPYEQSVKLTNDSDLPACYGLLFQEYEEYPSLLYSSAHPRGVIQPHSAVDIPLALRAKTVGRLQQTAQIAIFGKKEPPLNLLLSCIGEGPVVHVMTTEVAFGSIPVLTDVSRTLQLSNQSPIPARFVGQMVRSRSLWRVEPSEGEVPPQGKLELRLVAHLDDTLHFQDKLHLSIQNSETHTIPLSATGKGTTIVTNRPFAPSLDLGAHFSSGPCQYHFRVTNRGRRSHQLYWTTEGYPQFRRRVPPPANTTREGKGRSSLVPPPVDGPVFSLHPMRMELAPGHTADMVLEGSSDSPKVVRERLVCHAILGHQSGKERIMTVDVTCRFVSPILDISSQQLSFYVEKAPGVSLLPLYQKLLLRNVSSLALSLQLTLAEPFGLSDHDGDHTCVTSKTLVLAVGVQTEQWVRFDPLYRQDSMTRVAEEVLEVRYSDHPQQDTVGLRGEVHFPNLHFSSATLDFGCVLNHTEVQRQLTMTNCSPLSVSYHWAFLVDQQQYNIRFPEQTNVSEGRVTTTHEEERDTRWDLSKNRNIDIRVDSNREIEVPKLFLDEKVEEEKGDQENETKEGKGTPKDPLSAPVTLTLITEGRQSQGRGSYNTSRQEISRTSPAQWPASTDQNTGTASRTTKDHPSVGVEEVFDILPIYGVLEPGESQLVSFSFYGHADISGQVLALCEVEEGPTYEITLKGEASLVTYSLNRTEIDFGLQLFDHVAEAEITLRNTGKVGFQFSALLGEKDVCEDPRPGHPLVIPKMGYIEANAEQKLSVYYLPGVPEVFHKTFQLQVAFFEPESITLRGEGIFPRVCLDLPRELNDERYTAVVKEAKEALEEDRREVGISRPATGNGHLSDKDYIPTYDALLQMEVERLLVKQNAMAVENRQVDNRDTPASTSKWRKKLSRFLLPEYTLDFGYVIHGSVPNHIVKVTNTGPMSVSFRADRRPLTGTGFVVELDRVKNLPYCETETFEVKFDPSGANLNLGEINTVMPIQVVGGPAVQVHLCAVVTMPSLTVSTDTLQFDSIQCGLCQVTTVQLFNPEPVPCEWSITEEQRPRKKIDKHVPLHLRRKARLEQCPPPVVFEMLPSTGVLCPGDRVNVQVKFSPAEGRTYSQRLVVSVAQSTQRMLLLAQGQGEEPQLEFSSSVLELGPTLPFSAGEEAEVIVRNPCPFPIEFYSLEFDKKYLEEDKILRMMKGYDVQNVLLLPPRAPGESLPPELIDYYNEHNCEEENESKAGSPKDEEASEAGDKGEQEEELATPPLLERFVEEEKEAAPSKDGTPCGDLIKDTVESRTASVGDMEVNPVSRAIARHMGIDLSPEGQAARNRRGIAIIVHGAPLSGKTGTAVTLAKYYGAACLSVDAVVLEAMSSGMTSAGLRARELCAKAAMEHAQKRVEEAAQAVVEVMGPAGTLSVEAVAKHTAEGSQVIDPKALASSISTRNKNSVVGGKRIDGSQPTAPSMCMLSVQGGGPIHRQLSISVSQVGELGLMSCLLPDQLLVGILSERLQLSDCHRGVVMDGLETLYSLSPSSTLQIILKAFNNRSFIYMVNLSNNYYAFKAKERAQREAEEVLQREHAEKEKLRLQEMDEEEYDALPEEEKESIDLRHLVALRERKRREQERAEREQEERRQQEELERVREEEEMKKKNKKGKKEPAKDDSSGKKSQLGGKQSASALRSETKLDQPVKDGRKMSSCADGKEYKDSPTEGTREPEEGPKKKKPKEGKAGGQDESPLPSEDPERELSSEGDRLLLSRFRLYEQSQPQLLHILQFWDRAQGQLLQPLFSEDNIQEPEEVVPERQAPSGKKTKKEREKEKVEKEKERLEKEKLKADATDVKLVSPAPSQALLAVEGSEGGDREAAPETVPHILLSVTGRDYLSGIEILKSNKLPHLEEVLDGLGLGPKGPPIPPSTIFSVIPYPKKRPVPSAQQITSCFTFMVPSVPEDPTGEKKDADMEAEAQGSVKEEVVTPTKGRGKKADPGRESQKDKRRTPAKKGARSNESRSPPLNAVTPLSDTEQCQQESQQERNQRLTTFRWNVPPNGEVTLKIWFHSQLPGKFDQTLNFELLGTKRRYQMYCRGICAYPSISKDVKMVFSHSKRVLQSDEVLQKTYIIRSGLYEFGPLLCGKTRDRYKERKYPENMERLVIHNNSPLDAEIHFCFQHDTKATTYLLDPPNMTLKPTERQELTVWAYPTSPGQIEDSVVCCIKENPEPAIFRFSCRGVRPELEIERKQLHFDKILLHRKDTRNLCLRNNTLLPAAWRLSGLEVLGDEFSVSQDQGIILPHSEFCLQMHFRAMKPINLKRAIRLEVSDVENILGIVHTENIQILAEAYDVALDITFPKGADGGLDFGTIKVSEEVKLSVNMKNKGKYEIAFKFILEATDPTVPDLNQIFTITPQKGSLNPNDRPTCVQFVFRHNKEVSIREQPILRCQVIEPNIAEGGETIAIIPIKVSVQSLFSKYNIMPSSDINFGPLVYGCRKTQTFTIENKGDFEIRFNISRMCKDLPQPAQRRGIVGKRTSRENHSAKPLTGNKVRRAESIQKDMGMSTLARFTMGVFSLVPGFGILAPGAHQVVTVDCVAEQVGRWQECLALDITDRDPSDNPGGIPYRLVAEVCMSGIAYKDIASIFEEHRICKTSTMLYCEQFRDSMGIYIQDENKFVFNNVLVGRPAKARFRLTNNGKVPCELSLAVKPVLTKISVRSTEVFELTPGRLSIPSHSHAFAIITFAPQTMQTYHAVFEATLEGATSLQPMAKSKVLVFDLMGDGNLPSVAILRPVLRTSRGHPLLQFKRLLVGRAQTLPLVLKNDVNVPAQIHIDLLDKMGVFTLRAAPNTICSNISSSQIDAEVGTERQMAHTASLVLLGGQQAEFEVEFSPVVAQSFEANMRLLVVDNQYEETVVRLLGEGYHDVISLDNINSKAQQQEYSPDGKGDLLFFGDCDVSRPYQETFTMTNLSSNNVLRFEWPADGPQVCFSPQVGHLHAGCAKEVTVTFCSEQPVVLIAQPMKCKLCRVVFQQPVDQVPDWDDRLRTIKWVDSGKQVGSQQPTKKKVIETDPEPVHSVVEKSFRETELRISAVCDYAKFTCNAETIRFKDTLLYQTRMFQLQMVNKGSVKLEYSWQVLMDRYGKGVNFDHGDVSPRSCQSSRLGVRPASSLESVSCLMLGDPDLPPFSVEPSVGIISPGATQTFRIKFSPLEVAECEARLVCSIPNLKDEQSPTMVVCGRSLLPYCHFHLEDSDYISGNRRNPELRGPHGALPRAPLDPNTRVIEFRSVGIGSSILRQFSIVNPTNKPYSFIWRCEDAGASPFQCLTPNNSIQPGKKVEVSFEFQAQEPDTVESFWTFLIPDQNLSVPFLLVGTASEPVVYMDHAHLNLGNLLVGHKAHRTVYVLNGENQPFQFFIKETSRYSEAFLDSLQLEPLEGVVPPKDRFPVLVSFTPTQDGVVTFNLLVQVKGKVQPLNMNVKAEGYSMNACVQCESTEGGVTELSPGNSYHQVDFKQVELSDTTLCTFLVSNLGKFSLDVQYELWGSAEMQRHLKVETDKGSVEVGRQSRCTVTFFPLQKCVLKDVGLNIKIKNGPVFSCSILGSAVAPGLDFSFLKHNFGMSFIYCAGMVPATHTLIISNKGERGISLDCQFSNTPFLEVGFQPEVLPPGGSMEVPITFYPREAMRYHERVVFEINDCAKQMVEILGQGIEMKVDFEDPRHKLVNLGALQIGQKIRRVIPLVNNSHSSLTFSLLLSSTVHTLLDSRVLSVNPPGEVTLKPFGGRCLVEVLFSPRQRMAPFTSELQFECLGTVRPLLVLKGCCQGVEVKLDQDYLPFGAVAQRCKVTRRIIMQNTGDIGARFQWEMKRFGRDFSITPVEGYICPGMEVPFEVTFSPVELSHELRYDDLPCSIEGAKPIKLTLAGSCILPPVTKEVLHFVCQVRCQHIQSLTLSNRTNQRWTLKPVMEGEHWSGPPSFIIEPYQQNKAYEITYKPMVTTADGKKHLGSVFFSFPDGTGMLYTLHGTAEAPKAVATITHEMPSKTQYTEMVPVQNWLSKPQRFRAIVEIMKPERPDSTVSLKGLDYLDVPALAKRDYKVSFFTYKEGQYNAKVTFRNESTGEYLFYYLNFKATAPGVISTIEMVTPVRQTASASVRVENPLPISLFFSAECRSPDVSVPPQLSTPALSKATLSFEYQPLRAGESTARLILHNGELGYFHYELLLKALPASHEKPLYFRAPLGSGHSVSAKFTNYSRIKAEYACKTDSPDFIVEKNINAAAGYQAGTDISLEVYFEPCQLGEIRGMLTLSSGFGGEYMFPLFGCCTPPKAQGPFTIRAGSSVSIPFKNVFVQTTAFSFQVDSPSFTVKGVETIRPKKTHNILVMFEGPPPGSRGPCSGKLTISSPRSEGHGQSISWVFYLKGYCPELAQRDKTS